IIFLCYCLLFGWLDILYFFLVYVFFFFFQAEDGIRDDLVTGVQTCALPIFFQHRHGGSIEEIAHVAGPRHGLDHGCLIVDEADRSEERRVGKECRSRWWAYD